MDRAGARAAIPTPRPPGADALVLTMPQDHRPGAMTGFVDHRVEAATRGGMGRIVLDVGGTPGPADAHPFLADPHAIEARFAGSGLPQVILRPAVHPDDLAAPWAAEERAADTIARPAAPGAAVSWMSRRKLGAWVAGGWADGRTLPIGGPEAPAGGALPREVGAGSGRDMAHAPIPPAAFAEGMDAAMGAPAGDRLASICGMVLSRSPPRRSHSAASSPGQPGGDGARPTASTPRGWGRGSGIPASAEGGPPTEREAIVTPSRTTLRRTERKGPTWGVGEGWEDPMRHLTRSALAAAVLAMGLPAAAQDAEPMVDELHFLVPGGAGGGWDGTARGTGEALTEAGLLGDATYENMSGGGGGRAIAHLIETGDPGVIMVNSTPIVIRSLQGVFPQSFRDLTPVASVIGDYATLVVGKDSEVAEFQGLVERYQEDPASLAIGGGSVQGGMDHIVAALVMKSAGADPNRVKYIPYDTGGPAMAALLSGEIQALSTGLSEAIELARQGEVDILCVTAPERVDAVPEVPTCAEAGAEGAEFVNWRGFFAAPDIPEEQVEAYRAALEAMYETEAWATVRDRNGWVEIWNPGQEFTQFLEAQETQIGDLMRELGFL